MNPATFYKIACLVTMSAVLIGSAVALYFVEHYGSLVDDGDVKVGTRIGGAWGNSMYGFTIFVTVISGLFLLMLTKLMVDKYRSSSKSAQKFDRDSGQKLTATLAALMAVASGSYLVYHIDHAPTDITQDADGRLRGSFGKTLLGLESTTVALSSLGALGVIAMETF